jgi:hypothetical protein
LATVTASARRAAEHPHRPELTADLALHLLLGGKIEPLAAPGAIGDELREPAGLVLARDLVAEAERAPTALLLFAIARRLDDLRLALQLLRHDLSSLQDYRQMRVGSCVLALSQLLPPIFR